MSAKTSAGRREAFFRALAETGNQTISAERAKVSRSWVSLHRANDPAFCAAMEAAIVQARERLLAVKAASPARVGAIAKWSHIGGEELVIRGSRGRVAQVSRARVKQWTAATERRFLSMLAASCNVKMACAATGLSPASAYNHRNRWPEFARSWDAALEDGYVTVESALLELAAISFGQAGPDYTLPVPPMTAEQGLQLLSLHRARVSGRGALPGAVMRRPTEAETNAAIVKQLKSLHRKMLKQERAGTP